MDAKQTVELLQNIKRMADALEKLVATKDPIAPNYVKPLEDYANFDWASIEATVLREDQSGPTHLEYAGAIWTRRSPSNKYGEAIWYSRANGKDEDGNTKYLRLITFRPIGEADPVPEKVLTKVGKKPANGASPTQVTSGQKTAASPEKPSGITANEYYQLATGKRFNLTRQAAEAIARLMGGINAGVTALPYFAECKANGLDYPTAKSILVECGMDVNTALFKMRDNFAPGSP